MTGMETRGTARRHILISGASGGLGGALALAYAGPDIRLSLWGRNKDRLETVAEACRVKGAIANLHTGDTRELALTRAALHALDDALPLDMAILNAGVSSGVLPDGGLEPVEDVCRTLEVNALGTINMGAALLARMTARDAGRVVFISSLAAFYPLPSSPAYSAAKTAIAFYAKGTRASLPPGRTRISIVYPGYVDTPMSRRLVGPQPLRLTAEQAARYIRTKLDAGADDIVFPQTLALGLSLLRLLPAPVADFFARRFSFTVVPDAESPAASVPAPDSARSKNDEKRMTDEDSGSQGEQYSGPGRSSS